MTKIRKLTENENKRLSSLFYCYGFTDDIPTSQVDLKFKVDLLSRRVDNDLDFVHYTPCVKLLQEISTFLESLYVDELSGIHVSNDVIISHENDDWSDDLLNEECKNPLIHFE